MVFNVAAQQQYHSKKSSIIHLDSLTHICKLFFPFKCSLLYLQSFISQRLNMHSRVMSNSSEGHIVNFEEKEVFKTRKVI